MKIQTFQILQLQAVAMVTACLVEIVSSGSTTEIIKVLNDIRSSEIDETIQSVEIVLTAERMFHLFQSLQ